MERFTSFPHLIAEIGLNHGGSEIICKELIQSAAESGFDSIKFQYRGTGKTHVSAIEIGDELITQELSRSTLKPETIAAMAQFAKSFGLLVGISFFSIEDLQDFKPETHSEDFDFYKVPSAELENRELVGILLETNKPVLISTGMHSLAKIQEVLFEFVDYENWLPMHCVSNYPNLAENSFLGTIRTLEKFFKRPCGYSSHDSNFLNCLIALGAGAVILERHITLDKSMAGLDQSSSSNPNELRELANLWKLGSEILRSKSEPNSGEIINLQNLGRSFYANKDLAVGTPISRVDFDYRSPRTGMGPREFESFLGRPLIRPLGRGLVLGRSHLMEGSPQPEWSKLNSYDIALPVRLHDYETIMETFRLVGFEFHLSAEEVRRGLGGVRLSSDKKYAIHLPDYLDADNLLDPFSPKDSVAKESEIQIREVIDFGKRIYDLTGNIVPIVASFTSPSLNRETYFDRFAEQFNPLQDQGLAFTLQWMPPYAWYFGGSVPIHKNNQVIDAELIVERQISVTLDISHLIMSSRRFSYKIEEITSTLGNLVRHLHISDAIGIDGEGESFSDTSENSNLIISSIRTFHTLKTLEVWQGHLDGFKGFYDALMWLEARL